jgi:hypothetical protein
VEVVAGPAEAEAQWGEENGRLKNEWAAVGPAGLEKKKKRKSIKN